MKVGKNMQTTYLKILYLNTFISSISHQCQETTRSGYLTRAGGSEIADKVSTNLYVDV